MAKRAAIGGAGGWFLSDPESCRPSSGRVWLLIGSKCARCRAGHRVRVCVAHQVEGVAGGHPEGCEPLTP